LREQEKRIKDLEEQLNEQYRLRESQNDQYVKKLEQIQVFKSINFKKNILELTKLFRLQCCQKK
jgi:hypothetical protein